MVILSSNLNLIFHEHSIADVKLQSLTDIAKLIILSFSAWLIPWNGEHWANILEWHVLNLGLWRATLKRRRSDFNLWRRTLTSYMFGSSSQPIQSRCQYQTLRNASHSKLGDAKLYPTANTSNSLKLYLSHLRMTNVKLRTLADTCNWLMSSLLDYPSVISR